MHSKNFLDKLKGPTVLEDGSINHLKITKEEECFQKRFDRDVFPMCLELDSPKNLR
jgi:hypothetical protein